MNEKGTRTTLYTAKQRAIVQFGAGMEHSAQHAHTIATIPMEHFRYQCNCKSMFELVTEFGWM